MTENKYKQHQEIVSKYDEIISKYDGVVDAIVKCNKDEARILLNNMLYDMERCYSKIDIKNNKINGKVFRDIARYYIDIKLLTDRFEDLYDVHAFRIFSKCSSFFECDYTIVYQ